ncbi:MAG: hypothetical protein JNK82_19925 [Myxococcaceae bacterium]|nr:hypothetical protein [Myxococcaceae bacterium]
MMNRLVVVALLAAATASAQGVCSMSRLTQDLQLYRRLSLDLRGRAPSAAEVDALVARGALADSDVDALLRTDDFVKVEREHLRADVYGALNVIWDTDFGLTRTDQTSAFVYEVSGDVFWIPNRGPMYRQSAAFRTCDLGREQKEFVNDVPVADPVTGREGWVSVAPYWAPDTTIKVCAFDAQAHLKGPMSGVDCSTQAARGARDCGCGPDLRFCQGYRTEYPTPTTVAELNRSFAEQTTRFVDRILRDRRPYSDLILSDETEVNGPIAHYLRWQTQTVYSADTSSRSDLGYPIPALEFTETDKWQPVRVTGRAAGVLTQPHFLLKFATRRARANRFYNAFLCSSFQAPPGGLPSPGEPCSKNPNLAERCGCDSCHRSLEPMSAYWGRFAERGLHELKLPEFPSRDPACNADAGPLSDNCRQHYITQARHPAEAPYVGMLSAYLFADVGPTPFTDAIEQGPRALARSAVDSGAFARCTVTKQFTRLVGRAPREELADERALVDSLTERFRASNHDLRALVKDLVFTRQYRTQEGAEP